MQETKLPNYRKIFLQQFHHSNNNSTTSNFNNAASYQLYNSQPDSRDLPELFDFDDRELSISPNLNGSLVPQWAMSHLRLQHQRINNLNEFVPMTHEEMKVKLD